MTNPFLDAANNPSSATASSVGDATSSIANQTVEVVSRKLKNVPPQSERLGKIRPRYGVQTETENGAVTTFGNEFAERGQWAYIKLLTSQTQAQGYKSGSTNRYLSTGSQDLVGEGSIVSSMIDEGGKSSFGYDGFLLTGVSSDLSEKVQITEVFGDNEVIYYFGRQPMLFNISGVLFDSPDNTWFTDWLRLYSEFMRGTQTAKNYELLKLVLPNMAITGTMTSFSWRQDSQRDVDIPFSFQFIAKVIQPIPATGKFPVSNTGAKNIDFSFAAKVTSQKSINDLKGQSAQLTGVISNPSSSLRDKAAALSQLGTGVGGQYGVFLNQSKNTLDGYKSTIDGWTQAETSGTKSLLSSELFQSVTSSLNGIRMNLFSPVYGILSSLTKLVANTFTSASTVINSMIIPVRGIVRDVINISNQATNLVNTTNSSITALGRNTVGQLKGLESDFNTAVKSVKKAAGAIATAPVTAAQAVSNIFTSGQLPYQTPFLSVLSKSPYVRASLTITNKLPPTKHSILVNMPKYSSKTANKL